ncbi:WYL domain-containing protein [Pontibacter pamirensis]|uniref:WYL domain-containing protein n=1 Tax=Pontibacter pamirensis TaxID=2562824 RepID=UPI001389BB62|nr:WYL domain-containing protein [Pontibacter pamirensis]
MYSYLLEELSRAVGARLLIQFDYSGENYIVEPHLVGVNHHNQDCLCAWLDSQPAVAANTAAGWRCFLFSNMENVKLLDDRFCKKRPGYDPYNSSMNRIYYRI